MRTAGSVCVRGWGYLALTLALWLRRFSPRLTIALEHPASAAVSPRYLCGFLRGRREGISFSDRLFRDLVHPLDLRGCACEIRVTVKEPRLSLSLAEGLASERKLFFPPSPLGVQLAFCAAARMREVFVGGKPEVFASREMSSALANALASAGLLGEDEPADLLGDLAMGPEITIERVDGSIVKLSTEAYLDEPLESLAVAAALEVLGHRYVIAPSMIAVDTGEDVLFEIGEQKGESSVKVGFGGSAHFVRLVLARREKRVVGARGVVPRRRFPEVLEEVLVLLSRDGLCENLPTFAVARSTMLSDSVLLRGMLSLGVRTCL